LNKRVANVHNGVVNSVGIILNLEEYNNYDRLRTLVKNIGLHDNRVKFMAFIDDEKSAPNSWDSYFNPKSFDWKGRIKNVELQEFINQKFDALICYYKNDNLELNYVTALSRSNFKIGLNSADERLYDFIIDIETEYIQIFEKELIKYLKVLNKI
jgi:hypothetical protein